jgi:DNA polymerase-2
MRGGEEGDGGAGEIECVITPRPEPRQRRAAPIDHAHYVERQLAPACDVVLPFLGMSFDKVAGA